MLNTHTTLRLRGAALAGLLALALTGCVNTPPEQGDRLARAAGTASMSIVMPLGLWEQTKPTYEAELDELEPVPLKGEEGERGLVRVNLTGTQLVEYMNHLDNDAHGYGIEAETPENQAAAARVYTAISEVVDQITARTGEDQPAPEVVIDDTIGDEKK
ncbi:hypothetical protein ACFWTE_11695 [Nocardiopsis sp. NPDC058631]|uniref:hypothetical protein n=1 Tax=Nocardiopsis sp. NPDC058631 TaxID=3346566 RepID=UPI00365F8BDC